MKQLSKFSFQQLKIYLLLLYCFCAFSNHIVGQATEVNLINSSSSPNDFLGWDATVTDPIMLRHFHPDQHIEFHTNGQERMRVNASGNVCIGTTTQNAALTVRQMNGEYGIEANHSNLTGSSAFYTALDVRMNNNVGNVYNYAIIAEALGNASAQKVGLNAEAAGATDNYGVRAVSSPNNNGTAGWFNGDVVITGTFPPLSDQSLKTNVQPIENARELLLQLNPVKYEFINHSFLNLPQGEQYGLIAQ
ncbi:MAG: tail fiber domain-containing protein [Cryomorphaceae bacterium]|nr:tail fiber domain-containing protein [Flavobacteriales bacterium]